MATSKTAAKPARVGNHPGSYFLSLTVKNVRCFGPAQTLDLSDGHGRHAPWTIILGENGLGKTTLLTSLALSGSYVHFFRRHRIYLEDQLRGREPNIDNLRNVPFFKSGLEIFHVHMGLRRGDEYGTIKLVVTSDDIAKSTATVQINIHADSETDVVESDVLENVLAFHYGASRRMPTSSALVDSDERLRMFLDDDVILRNPEDWLLTADYNARLRGRDGKRFEAFAKRVKEALVGILPEVSDVRIQAAEEPSGSPRVEAQTPDGWIPLRRLGFGYQSQVAWLVDFASRMFEHYPNSADPLTEPAVVLIDEIDLHMHPRWQRQIIGFLGRRFSRTQFIVTAHSPLVVQAAAGANIVLLRREGDHVVIDNDPEVLENWRIDQILTSELFGVDTARPPQIEAPLKERRALLAKPKLSSRDRKRLAELEAQIGDLPAGESAEDRRAMELIRRAVEKLQSDA